MSLEDDDEDYEISNQVLNNYLSQLSDHVTNIEPNEFTETNEEPNLTDMLKEADKETLNTTLTSFDFIPSYAVTFFYDPTQINQSLLTPSNSMSDIDRNIVLNIQLGLLNKLSIREPAYIEIIQDLLISNTLIGLVLGSLFGFIVLERDLIFIASILVCTLGLLVLMFSRFKASVIHRTLGPLVSKAESYLGNIQHMMYYLKENEMVTLASRRQILIENKISSEQHVQDLNDSLNYSFRRLCFKKLRSHFYTLTDLNKGLLNQIDPSKMKHLAEIDSESFICCATQSELAEVLVEADENQLARLSDQFSLHCLRSLSKLVKLLVSESFKLIYITYLISSPIKNGLWSQIKFLIRQCTRKVFIYRTVSRLDSELKRLTSIVNLLDSDGQENSINSLSKKADYEHQLCMHLRNALLNSLALCEVKDVGSSKKRELLIHLKGAFELCDFYLKKVVNDVEGLGDGGVLANSTEMKVGVEQFNSGMNVKVKSCDQECPLLPNEDVIFEADTVDDVDGDIQVPQVDVDAMLEEKRVQITSKNLFYELKFALRNKRNEWREREKSAKRIDGEGRLMVSDDKILKNEQCDLFENKIHQDQHLLENDVLKYKSALRRRKRDGLGEMGGLVWEDTEKQDLLETKKYRYEDDEESSHLQFKSTINIMSEFMSKRKGFFACENKNADDLEDETVYE